MLCIPLRKFFAFLSIINPKNVRADQREKVILYQNECDDTLWNYWTNGREEHQSVTESNQLPPTDHYPRPAMHIAITR
ncbi:MAG: hypothetical protein IKN64_02120 [Desulfovibrio sp.]|nr:hypothetical protein [Desulfovibrio sp.]